MKIEHLNGKILTRNVVRFHVKEVSKYTKKSISNNSYPDNEIIQKVAS